MSPYVATICFSWQPLYRETPWSAKVYPATPVWSPHNTTLNMSEKRKLGRHSDERKTEAAFQLFLSSHWCGTCVSIVYNCGGFVFQEWNRAERLGDGRDGAMPRSSAKSESRHPATTPSSETVLGSVHAVRFTPQLHEPTETVLVLCVNKIGTKLGGLAFRDAVMASPCATQSVVFVPIATRCCQHTSRRTDQHA